MKAPRVSFVMSVYNDADRVTRSVKSILNQTLSDLELIIVNDGSTDQTESILHQLAQSDERIIVVTQENAGLTKALIRGCELARGEYIARQDSDDWSEPTRIEKQVGLLVSNERIGFVSCFGQFVGPGEEHLNTVIRDHDPENATHRLLHHKEGPPAHGSVMFRKSLYDAVGGYRPEFYFSQDSDLWLRMAEKSLIAYVPEQLYSALREAEGISGAHRPVQAEFGQLCHAAREARLKQKPEQPILEQAQSLRSQLLARKKSNKAQNGNANSMKVAYLLGSQLVHNKDARARAYLLSVLKSRPWHMKAWFRLVQSYLTGQRFTETKHE